MVMSMTSVEVVANNDSLCKGMSMSAMPSVHALEVHGDAHVISSTVPRAVLESWLCIGAIDGTG